MLAYAFPPENLPGAARPYRFYRYLPEFGYEPFVITGSAQDSEKPHPNVEYVADPAEISSRRSAPRLLQAIIRKTIRPGDDGSLWTPRALQAAERLMRKIPISAIHSTYPPLNAHLTALTLKRRHGLPWIADFRDPLAGNPVVSLPKLAATLEQFIERRIFSAADALTAVTDVMAGQSRERYPRQAHKIHVLWNGYDPAQQLGPLPIPPRPYRVLTHIGTFYGGRTPTALLGSARRLMDQGRIDPNRLRLRFLGDFDTGIFTPEHRLLFDSLAEKGVLECDHRHVPHTEALRVMAESDYLYLADNNSSNAGYTVPAKLFEYVQMGRPILAITASHSPVERILKQSGIPHVTAAPNLPEEELDRRVFDFLQLPSDPVAHPSDWYRNTFDGRRQTGVLAGILDSLLK